MACIIKDGDKAKLSNLDKKKALELAIELNCHPVVEFMMKEMPNFTEALRFMYESEHQYRRLQENPEYRDGQQWHDPWASLLLKKAACQSNAKTLRALLAAKLADVNYLYLGKSYMGIANNEGGTPLIFATIADNQDAMRTLVDAGADINLQDINGSTALMFAAVKGNPAAITYLLDSGAEIDLQDGHGKTALMYGVLSEDPDAVRMLLKAGAKADHRSHDGRCVADLIHGAGSWKSEDRRKAMAGIFPGIVPSPDLVLKPLFTGKNIEGIRKTGSIYFEMADHPEALRKAFEKCPGPREKAWLITAIMMAHPEYAGTDSEEHTQRLANLRTIFAELVAKLKNKDAMCGRFANSYFGLQSKLYPIFMRDNDVLYLDRDKIVRFPEMRSLLESLGFRIPQAGS